ncbi:unnamed protein product [Musa textilis]
MSTLNSIPNRASFGTKTCLNLAISRIKLLQNKRELQLKHMRKEISQYIQTGQEAIARIRVEDIIREQNILAAYEIIELFCEFVLACVPILETQRFSFFDFTQIILAVILLLQIFSVIYHAPRMSSFNFVEEIAEKLLCFQNLSYIYIEVNFGAPSAEVKVKVLKAIAQEYNLEWDSSDTESELNKKHEDLLVKPLH